MLKIKKSGLEQYGAEHFGRLIFSIIRKSVGLKGLKFEPWLCLWLMKITLHICLYCWETDYVLC